MLFTLSVFADIAGIISLFFTVALLIHSKALRKEIGRQKREYQKDQKELAIKMIALRENLWAGQPLSLRLISEVRTMLYSFEQKFGRLRRMIDKIHFRRAFRLLEQTEENVDVRALCREMDYFIARMERQEQE